MSRLDQVRWILFDAVGTLIYPDPPVAEVYQSVAGQFGSQRTATEIGRRFGAAFANEFGNPACLRRQPTSEQHERERWRRLVTAVLDDIADAGGEPFERLWQHFAQPASWRLFADVAPTLGELAAREFRLGIASNFDSRLQNITRSHPPLAVCERVFVSSEVGFSKPDPRFFAAVETQLAVRGSKVLLVGDDDVNDAAGAAAADWQAVLLDRSEPKATSGTIRSLAELLG